MTHDLPRTATRPRALAIRCAMLILTTLVGPAGARATSYYADPVLGSPSGDGSPSRPWRTLQEVAEAGLFGTTIGAGDTLWLRSGYHGQLVITSGSYATPITVAAQPGHTPQVRRVSFANTHGWALVGLSISPSHAAVYGRVDMASINSSSSDILIEGCELFSVRDASGWTATQWINDASNGVVIGGDHVTVRNNAVKNVRFGISVTGPNAIIERNWVVNFSADGVRGLGNYGTYQYNIIKNVYVSQEQGDTNHDDGFQSWSQGPGGPGTGEVVEVVLRGNTIINREDPNQPLQNAMQGIGCFDGFFVGWVVENNVVVTDHWHGITFSGMRQSRIVNNTVIDINNVTPGPPWIRVGPHKNGTPSENVVVRNNLSTDLALEGIDIVADHNTELTDPAAYFVNPRRFDLHLLPNAPAVNTGSADLAPPLDRDGVARPQGPGFDRGAYEWGDLIFRDGF